MTTGPYYAVLPVVQTGFGLTIQRAQGLSEPTDGRHTLAKVRGRPRQHKIAKLARLPRHLLPNATKSSVLQLAVVHACHLQRAATADCEQRKCTAASRLRPALMPPCAAQRTLAGHGMPKLAAANSAERAQREWSPRPRRGRERATSEPQRAPSMPCSCPVPLEPPAGHTAPPATIARPLSIGGLRGLGRSPKF